MTALIRLSLPDPLRAFVDEQVARHGFGSAGEYLAALVARAMERDARGPGAGPIEPWIELGFRSREELEAELLKGLDSPASEMTAEDWTELRRRIIERSPELQAEG